MYLVCREQAEEADEKLEKMHMAVVQGEHRKRQRGVGVDDSDEESEDGGNSRARRAMKKLKMIERGDIKDLGMISLSVLSCRLREVIGANEATRAFADTYKQTLQDDDQEFSYLDNQSDLNDIPGFSNPYSEDEPEEEQEEGDRQEEETISHEEVIRQIRQRKQEAVCFFFFFSKKIAFLSLCATVVG
jgi:mediator of replication checkpoint protein 1